MAIGEKSLCRMQVKSTISKQPSLIEMFYYVPSTCALLTEYVVTPYFSFIIQQKSQIIVLMI